MRKGPEKDRAHPTLYVLFFLGTPEILKKYFGPQKRVFTANVLYRFRHFFHFPEKHGFQKKTDFAKNGFREKRFFRKTDFTKIGFLKIYGKIFFNISGKNCFRVCGAKAEKILAVNVVKMLAVNVAKLLRGKVEKLRRKGAYLFSASSFLDRTLQV